MNFRILRACKKWKICKQLITFFMGNASIIWQKIDWFVQLKKPGWYWLIVAKGCSAEFTTWLIVWLIANFRSEPSQFRSQGAGVGARKRKWPAPESELRSFENLALEPLNFIWLHQPWFSQYAYQSRQFSVQRSNVWFKFKINVQLKT